MTTQVTFRMADEEDAEHFRLRMKEGEVWLAEAAGGGTVGAYELWWDDEPAWGVPSPVCTGSVACGSAGRSATTSTKPSLPSDAHSSAGDD